MNTQFEFNSTVASQVITKTGAGILSFGNGNNGNLGAGANSRFILDEGTLNFSNGNGNMFGGASATLFEIRDGTFLDTANASFDVVSSKNQAQIWAGDFTSKSSTGKSLNLGTGAVMITGGSRTITVNASTLTVGGVIGDAGNQYSLTKTGAGTLSLAGTNAYGGATTISGGTLVTGVVNALPGTTEVMVVTGTVAGDSGILNINGRDQTVGKLSTSVFGAGTRAGVVMNNAANSTATLTVTGTSQFDGVLKNGTTAPSTRILALTKSTGGTLTLTGTNTYTGATTITGGTLALASTGSINNTSGVSLGTGGSFDVSARVGSYTVVNLTGSGNIIGSLTVSTQLAIGNSPGTTIFDNLTLGSTSIYIYELTGGSSPGAGSADLGIVSGDLALTGGAVLDLVQLGSYTAGNKFTLFAYSGTLSGIFKDTSAADLADGATFTDALGIWSINYNDTTAGLNGGTTLGASYVTITAVPEPRAALIGGLGMLALLRRRR